MGYVDRAGGFAKVVAVQLAHSCLIVLSCLAKRRRVDLNFFAACQFYNLDCTAHSSFTFLWRDRVEKFSHFALVSSIGC